MYTYTYKYRFSSELLKYEESRLQSKDILVLRNIILKTRSQKYRLAALKTLVEYKDVKSIKALSKIYKRTSIIKSMALIHILVELGDKKTIYELAKYLNRSNIQKDKIKALEYFKRLAKQGHIGAIKHLSNY
ncbi:MAG: HEAT repeat domain-containing protein [Campylobacteraceae bacterium]|nr:HEAT repeat domain-containing protein [Campylobacteraceae bacterium]